MKYSVGVVIYNSYTVEANNKEEAEQSVRDMDNDQILDGSDFNIYDIEEEDV